MIKVLPESRGNVLVLRAVLGDEYQQLINDIMHHHKPALDAYGATNPAEFLAVVTEAFF
jgi:Mlc titration factor MtfA (ptsG expression regulator)